MQPEPAQSHVPAHEAGRPRLAAGGEVVVERLEARELRLHRRVELCARPTIPVSAQPCPCGSLAQSMPTDQAAEAYCGSAAAAAAAPAMMILLLPPCAMSEP